MRLAEDVASKSESPAALAPPTGCVLLNEQGGWLASMGTSRAGTHPELAAIRRANQTGLRTRKGTAVVTMEPCRECAEALVRAGIQNAVWAVSNPTGGGASLLLEAGVDVVTGVCETDVSEGTLWPWLYAMRTGTPYVTWAYAASPWGRLALLESSGEVVNRDLTSVRQRADVVLTGTDEDTSMSAVTQTYPGALHVLAQDDPGPLIASVNRIIQYVGEDFRGASRVPRAPRTESVRLASAVKLNASVVRMVWDIEK